MKRTTLILLIVLLALSALPACAQTPAELVPEGARVAIYTMAEDMDQVLDEAGGDVAEGVVRTEGIAFTYVQSLSEALLLLGSGRVDAFLMAYDTMRYLAAQDDCLTAIAGIPDTTFHMITGDTQAELVAQIDEALAAIEADGTLDALRQTQVEDVIAGANPVAVALPVTEGAPTYRVGVSGDLPPLDYTTADGTPAGFNTALLAELAGRLGVNFELVTIESGARFLALETGTVDLFFWHNNIVYGQAVNAEQTLQSVEALREQGMDGYLITAPYYVTKAGWLMKTTTLEK